MLCPLKSGTDKVSLWPLCPDGPHFDASIKEDIAAFWYGLLCRAVPENVNYQFADFCLQTGVPWVMNPGMQTGVVSMLQKVSRAVEGFPSARESADAADADEAEGHTLNQLSFPQA